MSSISSVSTALPTASVVPNTTVTPPAVNCVPPTLPPTPSTLPGGLSGTVDEAKVQALLGQMGIRQPNAVSTVLSNTAIGGGIGVALGLAASFLPLIGPMAAVIGGGIGAVIGLAKGLVNASDDADQYRAAHAWASYQMRGGSHTRPTISTVNGTTTLNLPQGWTLADLERLDQLDGSEDAAPALPVTPPTHGSTSTSTTTTTGTPGLAPPPSTALITGGAPPVLTGL